MPFLARVVLVDLPVYLRRPMRAHIRWPRFTVANDGARIPYDPPNAGVPVADIHHQKQNLHQLQKLDDEHAAHNVLDLRPDFRELEQL